MGSGDHNGLRRRLAGSDDGGPPGWLRCSARFIGGKPVRRDGLRDALTAMLIHAQL